MMLWRLHRHTPGHLRAPRGLKNVNVYNYELSQTAWSNNLNFAGDFSLQEGIEVIGVSEPNIRPAAGPPPEQQGGPTDFDATGWEPMTVRDKSGKVYTFFHEGTHLSFIEQDDLHAAPEDRVRIQLFTYPRGRIRCFLHGLMMKGDFKFVDEHGQERHIRATEDILMALMKWDLARHEPRESVLDWMPRKLRSVLENAESGGFTFDLLLPAEVMGTEFQAFPRRGDSAAVVALSDEEVLIATQVDNLSAAFPRSSVKVPLSEITIDVVLDLPKEEVTSGARACARGKRLGSMGEMAVCRLKTKRGQEIFLALRVGDVNAAKRRITGVTSVEVRPSLKRAVILNAVVAVVIAVAVALLLWREAPVWLAVGLGAVVGLVTFAVYFDRDVHDGKAGTR